MNTMKYRPLFYALSSFLVIASIYSIIRWQFVTSIDFSGGTVWEITLPAKPATEEIKRLFSQNDINLSSVSTGQDSSYQLKFSPINSDQKAQLDTGLTGLDDNFTEIRFETLSPTLGRELLQKTLFAIILSALTLLIFIGRRFKDFSFGIAAVLAMFHDTFILIGSFALLGHLFGAEIDALFVTAILTTLSASVHDTIVTFDRIRELKHQSHATSWVDLANKAVGETLVRSLNNSVTILIMLFSLVILGGTTTKWFALDLLIGAVLGTYSSLGVAVPLFVAFKSRSR